MVERIIDKITKFEYYDIVSKKYHDISNMVHDIKWVTDMESAGVLTFSIFKNTDRYGARTAIKVSSGDQVTFDWDNKRIFKGWVFTRKRTEEDVYEITAYDNLRYLKGVGTYVWSPKSSSERFTTICQDLGLPYRDDDFDTHRSPAEITDGKTYFDMIKTTLDNTRQATGKRFFIMDDGNGTLVHTSLDKHRTTLVFGDGANVTGFNYTATIDNDTANRVTLVREDDETKKRTIQTVQNDERIQRWGLLTYAETISDKLNAVQLRQRAQDILNEKVAEKVEFSFSALGDVNFRAGTGFISNLSANLEELGSNRSCYATKVTHNFGESWTMDIDVEVLPL